MFFIAFVCDKQWLWLSLTYVIIRFSRTFFIHLYSAAISNEKKKRNSQTVDAYMRSMMFELRVYKMKHQSSWESSNNSFDDLDLRIQNKSFMLNMRKFLFLFYDELNLHFIELNVHLKSCISPSKQSNNKFKKKKRKIEKPRIKIKTFRTLTNILFWKSVKGHPVMIKAKASQSV